MKNEIDKKETNAATTSDLNVLSAEERALFAAFNQQALAAKVQIHDLNIALEKAQLAREQAESRFGGALAAIATARGLRPPINISPDFTRIEGAKE